MMIKKSSILLMTIAFFIISPIYIVSDNNLGLFNVNNSNDMIDIVVDDINLYTALKKELKDISFNDNMKTISINSLNISKVTRLDLSNSNISNLSGIDKFTNLKDLDIHGNVINDLSPLKMMNSLEVINVSMNKLVDTETYGILNSLSSLNNLKELDISHNSIKYLNGLEHLTSLKSLNVYDNFVKDLEGIQNLVNLECLNLGQNNEGNKQKIVNLSYLTNFHNLKYLNFSENFTPEIIDYIGNLKSLEYLYLERNSLKNISNLSNLINLKELNLYRNSISNVSILSNLTNLEVLVLQQNNITDITSFISDDSLVFNRLKKIDLSRNYSLKYEKKSTNALNKLIDMARNGLIEFNYEEIFDTSQLPHVDSDGIRYVTYEDFGARADGIYDDFISIRNAHNFANLNNCEVRATNGKIYHIFKYYEDSVSVRTSVDWKNATFIIHDELIEQQPGRFKSIFTFTNVSDDVVTITNPSWTINELTKKIPQLFSTLTELNSKGYQKYYVALFNDDKKQFIRYGSNQNDGQPMQDYFFLDSKGNVLNDIKWDFDHITSLTIYPVANESLSIKNGKFISNNLVSKSEVPYTRGSPKSIYFSRNIVVKEATNVNVSNIINELSDSDTDLSGSYFGFLQFNKIGDLNISDCKLISRRYNSSGRSTYGVTFSAVTNAYLNNVRTDHIFDSNRWGVMQSDFGKDFVVDNSYLNRVDAHQGIYNLTVKNSEIGFHGLTVTGKGELNILNSKITAEKMISLRNDYGSTWDGNINIIDSEYKYIGQWHPRIVSFTFSYDDKPSNTIFHDFGYVTKHPNLYIENLVVNNENIGINGYNNLYAISNFSSDVGNPFYGNPSYWPSNIYINGIKFINNDVNAKFKLSVSKVDKTDSYNYFATDLKLSSNGINITKDCLKDEMEVNSSVNLIINKMDTIGNKVTIFKDDNILVDDYEINDLYKYNFTENGYYKIVVSSFDNYYDGTAIYNFIINKNSSHLLGDVNVDGKVDLTDILRILKGYFSKVSTSDYPLYDLDKDGDIDLTDVLIVLKIFFNNK